MMSRGVDSNITSFKKKMFKHLKPNLLVCFEGIHELQDGSPQNLLWSPVQSSWHVLYY